MVDPCIRTGVEQGRPFYLNTHLARVRRALTCLWLCLSAGSSVIAFDNVRLSDVPDYSWYAGCFGTAGGNLMGFWDRHGFPDFYTGPTNSGLAPLNSSGVNSGIRSLWASRAGMDGRPLDQPGHIDDYWMYYDDANSYSYESVLPDPYLVDGRAEHAPDCVGDFIGASQRKWTLLNGLHDGNIDGFAVCYWDPSGARRVNFVPPDMDGVEVRDVPSGLRAWTRSLGFDARVFSQLADFHSGLAPGVGFTFEQLRAEIDAGYPVMLFLQNHDVTFRSLPGMERANPSVHGMLAYGYVILDSGERMVRYKSSWGGSGDNLIRLWGPHVWEAMLQLKGVIGYHPLPVIRSFSRVGDTLELKWHGPSSEWVNMESGETRKIHRYVVEAAESADPEKFQAVTEPSTSLEASIPNCCGSSTFYRVRLLDPAR